MKFTLYNNFFNHSILNITNYSKTGYCAAGREIYKGMFSPLRCLSSTLCCENLAMCSGWIYLKEFMIIGPILTYEFKDRGNKLVTCTVFT